MAKLMKEGWCVEDDPSGETVAQFWRKEDAEAFVRRQHPDHVSNFNLEFVKQEPVVAGEGV